MLNVHHFLFLQYLTELEDVLGFSDALAGGKFKVYVKLPVCGDLTDPFLGFGPDPYAVGLVDDMDPGLSTGSLAGPNTSRAVISSSSTLICSLFSPTSSRIITSTFWQG